MDSLVSMFTIKNRYKAMFFGKSCDPLSQCAKSARDILSLLDKKKNLPEQNELIKDEIWVILDHEKLLSNYQCSALSKLTLQELLTQMMKCKSNEELILFVEAMDSEMDQKYTSHLVHSCPPFNLQALIHKHMGHGIEYLKEMRNFKQPVGFKRWGL
jgi:hypothetical protein